MVSAVVAGAKIASVATRTSEQNIERPNNLNLSN